jgi:ADP-ribosylglycohydrolase
MIPNRQFNVPAGSWTDDTSMMLCLAASFAECGGDDPADQLDKYLNWLINGYMSSVPGTCIDIGNTTRDALIRYNRTGQVIAATTKDYHCGNGSLMRMAPAAIWYAARTGPAVLAAADAAHTSLTTHAHPVCIEFCARMAEIIILATRGVTKEALADRAAERWGYVGLAEKERSAISSSGYVVDTLEAAMWAFFRTETFRDGAVLAVNLAHDADTVGAVYGAIAGAYYGFAAIPQEWLSALQEKDTVTRIVNTFVSVAVSRV